MDKRLVKIERQKLLPQSLTIIPYLVGEGVNEDDEYGKRDKLRDRECR